MGVDYNIYYVDKNLPGASDSNPGTESLPWLTIQKALNTVVVNDTVYIKSGTYTQTSLTMVTGGIIGNPITISNYLNDKVIIDFSSGTGTGWNWNGYKNYIIVNGFEIRNSKGNGILVKGDYNQITNNIIHDCGVTNKSDSISLEGGSSNLIENNDIYNSGGNGIYIENRSTDGASGNAHYNTITNNKVHNNLYGSGIAVIPNTLMTQNVFIETTIKFNKVYANSQRGIYLRKQNGARIFSNLIYDNLGTGLELGWQSSGDGTNNSDSNIVNNTIVYNLEGIRNLTDIYITLKNNIISYNTNYQLYYGNNMFPYMSNNNLYYTDNEFIISLNDGNELYSILDDFSSRYKVESNSIQAIPYFYNISQDDYRLSQASMCIDSGETLSSIYEKDIRDITRPLGNAWDIGAYEYIYPSVSNYYVDNAAVSGNNTGLNWTNAWTSFSLVQWNLMQSGSTLHISGGVVSKSYGLNDPINILASGITIKKSTDLNHNGEVVLDGTKLNSAAITASGLNNITLDGISLINVVPITSYEGAIKFTNLTTPLIKNCTVLVSKGSAVEFNTVISGVIDNITQTTLSYTSAKTNLAYIRNGSSNTIQDCSATISNTHATANIKGIYVNKETNPIIQRNRIYLNTGLATTNKDGIYCENNQGIIKIYNNLVYSIGNATGAGIAFKTTNGAYSGYTELYNNTVYLENAVSDVVRIEDTVINLTDRASYVFDNIFYVNASGYAAYFPATFITTAHCNYNIYYNTAGNLIEHSASDDTWASWQTKGYDTTGYNQQPDFDIDYKLAKTSVGVDKAWGQNGINVDIDGVTRPQGVASDIGAYETRKGYYVDNECASIANNGLSWATAWTSFNDVDWSLFEPGDALYISGGPSEGSQIYYEQLTITASGSYEYPIYILPGLDDNYNGQVIVDGLNLTKTYGIYINGQDNIIISGLTFRNSISSEIYSTKSDNIKIYDCNILFYGRGIDIRYGVDCVVSGCSLNSPIFIGAETDGIYGQDNLNMIIENNYVAVYNDYIDGQNDCIQIFRNNGTIIRNNYCIQDTNKLSNSRGIYGSTCSGDIYIYNNVVNMNDTVSIAIGYQNLDTGTADAYILNNTIFGTKLYNGILTSEILDPKIKNNIIQSNIGGYVINISAWNGDPSNIDYNIYYNSLNSNVVNVDGIIVNFEYWQGYLFDEHSYNLDPKFVNEDNGNLQLQSDSPAKDTGTNLSGLYTYDINNVSRPYETAWDMGAYEGSGYDITNPTVLSAELLNANSIKIYFSEELVKSSAENITSYSIVDTGEVDNPNPGVISVVYDNAARTVTLSTTTHSYSTFTVTVEKVLDLAGNVIDTTQNSADYYYYYVDTTRPRLLSVELLTNTIVRLTFDEALNLNTAQNYRNYIITNRTVYAAIYNAQEYTVTLLTDIHSYGSYTVTVTSVTDLAGNTIDSNYDEASYDLIYVDTEAPRLVSAVTNQAGNKLNVSFSEAIDTPTLENINNYSISGLTISGLFSIGLFGDKVNLFTSNMIDSTTYTLVISSGLTDISGNPIDTYYNTLNFIYTANPAILLVSGIDNSTIDIYFTHSMDITTLEDLDSYEITGPGTASVDVIKFVSDNHITVGTTQPTASGLYTITINNALDVYGLEMVAPDNDGTYNVYGDFDPPEIVSAELLSSNSLKITFNEKLYADVSQNVGQYEIQKLSVSGWLKVEDVYVADSDVYLTTDNHSYLQDYRIIVSGIQDMYGNTIASNNTSDYSYNVSGISLNITSPAGGETYYNGQYKPITWTLEEL